MQFRRADLADLSYFLEIAKHRNFRRAALELGVGASALSHAIRSLEERGLQQVACGASHFCHSGVSITFCC